MKKTFRNLAVFVAILFLNAIAFSAEASHLHGAELTYESVAPNVYVVTLRLHRECQGHHFSNSNSINISSAGCNPGRTQPVTQLSRRSGDFYCSLLGSPVCSSTGKPNYEEVVFTTTVAFSAAEAQCPDWRFSWSECCYPNAANLVNPMGHSAYVEAFVKLRSGTTTILNNSPQFVQAMAQILNERQPTVLSNLAADPDGDSLVYSLQAPLISNGNSVAFSSFAPGHIYEVNPQDTTQIAFYRPGSQQYSPTFPFPAYTVDWNLPAPRYLNKDFLFNSDNGSMNFTSPKEVTGGSVALGLNKYLVRVQVDEYRKIGGLPVKIGSVSRVKVLLFANSGLNANPTVSNVIANGQAIVPATIINLRAGSTMALTFSTTDGNSADTLSLDSNAETLLLGSVFSKTSGNRPTGTIFWTPTAAQVRDQIYYFNVTVQDNACPVKGIEQQTFGVRVSHTGGVTGIGNPLPNPPVFSAYPNPFASEVTFRVKQTQPQQHLLIYNVLGQLVDQVYLSGQAGTEQEVSWSNAAKFPAGQYIVRFGNTAGQGLKINKLQ